MVKLTRVSLFLLACLDLRQKEGYTVAHVKEPFLPQVGGLKFKGFNF